MMMRRLIALGMTLLLFGSNSAHAYFVFFIPGSASGAEGENCVGPDVKPGDILRAANGGALMVTSLSGASSRCADPARPIAAVLAHTTSSPFNATAGIKLPDGYVLQDLTERQRYSGILLKADNDAANKDESGDTINDFGVSTITVTATKRDVIADLPAHVANVRTSLASGLNDPEQSDIEQLTINGMRAWRFEVRGKLKGLFGIRVSSLVTILEGDQEVVAVSVSANTDNYQRHREEFMQSAFSVAGIHDVSAPVVPTDAGVGK